MNKKVLIIFILVMFVLGLNISISAADNQYVSVDIASGGLFLTPKVSHSKMIITLSAPNGAVYSKTFTSGSGFASISELSKGNVFEGPYTFEVVLYPQDKKDRTKEIDRANKSDNDRDINNNLIEPMSVHGHFTVTNGTVLGGNTISSTTGDQDGGTEADQVILDDLIVDGSICVGMDCVNGESFGFDTIRLKENNLRIRFVDTSATASFPSRDWEITVNDSANGGGNYFAITDIDGGRVPFRIEAGAPSHSLYVDDGGRVGFGTSTPVVDLHLKTGNTPTLRLEQDGSSGFTPQTWDVAGNEANFFIRDATNGSTLPIRIQPGAPSSALSIKSDGKIGIGTWSPSVPLEVQTTGTAAKILVNRTDGVQNIISATGDNGFFGTQSDHPLRFAVNNGWKMQLNNDGSVDMQNGASLTAGGVWTDASSRAYKENIRELSEHDAMDALINLTPVKYNYKKEKNEDYVGFIAEDVPDLVSFKSKDRLSPMDIVAVLTKVVKVQQKSINELKKKISKLEKKK